MSIFDDSQALQPAPAAGGWRILRRGFRRAGGAPLLRGNRADLLVDGRETYPAMLDLIRRARHRVHLENYQIRGDAVGRRFREALAEAARRGVEVRVICDWLGSWSTGRGFWTELREAGGEVRTFGPPSLRRPLSVFRRDHRKLLVVDGCAGIVGGLGIGREWEGESRGRPSAASGLRLPDAEAHPQAATEEPWRDTAVRLEGPVAGALDETFLAAWSRCGGGRPSRAAAAPGPEPGIGHRNGADPDADGPRRVENGGVETEGVQTRGVAARVVAGPPNRARAYRLYQLVSALVERRLFVTGAYPLVPASLRSALSAAARAGVDVRLLVPGRSDLPLLNMAARAQYGPMLEAGVKLYEWKGAMLHAKTVVADGTWALIGSSNLNPVSLLGTYELDVEIHDRRLAGELETLFRRDLERSRRITLSEWTERPLRRKWAEQVSAALLWLPSRLYAG